VVVSERRKEKTRESGGCQEEEVRRKEFEGKPKQRAFPAGRAESCPIPLARQPRYTSWCNFNHFFLDCPIGKI